MIILKIMSSLAVATLVPFILSGVIYANAKEGSDQIKHSEPVAALSFALEIFWLAGAAIAWIWGI